MNQILLNGINLSELLEKIGQVIDVKLKSAIPTNNTQSSKFITRKEVCDLLKITLPTLNDCTKLGWLKSYKLGNRVLYRHGEIELAISNVATYKFKKGGNHGA